MKNLRKLVLICIGGMITTSSFGQFTLSGEYRPRAEYSHGYKSVADSNQADAFYISQRARLNFDYKVKDYEFYVAVQDIRVWGASKTLTENGGFLALHQAWAKAKFNDNWGLKLGRQEISYDDQRIFGAVGWAQQARSHDAALIQFKGEKSKLDVGFAWNQDGVKAVGTDYTVDPSYRDMQYVHFNTKFGEKVNMSLLGMNIGQQVNYVNGNGEDATSMNYYATLGTHTKFNFGKFKANLNGYYQMGSANTTGTSVSAYLLGLDLNYQIAESFGIGLGYEAQSGNNPMDTTKAYNEVNHAFNPRFGTNHKFNGFMDYFYVGNWGNSVGLQDAYLKLKFKKGNWFVGADVHMFMTGLGTEVMDNVTYQNEYDQFVIDGDQASADALDPFTYKYASNLGTEIDLTVGTKINKSVSVKLGYSVMMASETMNALKGVDTYWTDSNNTLQSRELPLNSWGYAMVIFKPTFLNKGGE